MTPSKKSYAKSFISEHSVEYVLVPNLKNILEEKFGVVTPIFPWLTREGSTLARHLHKGERFRVIGLYPRRPKLVSADSSIITVKLNRQIMLGAEYGKELGIPIIAGCPLAKDFWDLGNSPECLWIKLDEGSGDDVTLEIENIQPPRFTNKISNYIFRGREDLLVYLMDKTISMDLDTAMLSFRDIRRASWGSEYHGFFGLMSGYKPVYFLLK